MDRLQRRILPAAWLGWLFLYMWGVPALSSPETSFLSAPLDQPLPMWVKWTFMNLPLQAICIFTALSLIDRSPPERISGAARGFSVVATVLILANLLIAVWSHFGS